MNKKRVNDIFYSLQGEGHNTGRAAIFIRFSGCNLKCPFCDTDFSRYDELTDDDIIERIKDFPSRFVVLTGGEPSLQVDTPLIDKLHAHGYEIAMETNGTHPVPAGIDWTTCSPKGVTNIKSCDELKVALSLPAAMRCRRRGAQRTHHTALPRLHPATPRMASVTTDP